MILVTPVAAILVLAGVVGYDGVAEGQRAEQARQVVSLGGDAAVLVAQLHHERAGAALVFASGPADEPLAAYRRTVLATDAAAATFRQHSRTVDVSADVRVVLDRVGDGLDDLAALRQQVQADPKAVSSVVLFRYRALVADLLTFRQALSQIGVPAATGNELRAVASLSRAIEAQGLLQVAVVRAAGAGELTPAAQEEIVGASSGYDDALVDFQLLAPAAWRTALNARVNGAAVLQAEREQGVVARTPPGQRLRLSTDVAGWSAAVGARMDLLHEVESAADRQILVEVTGQRDAARRAAAMVAGAVLAGLLLTVVIGAAFTVSLSRSLTRLRYQAADVATVRLPELVARIDAHHTDPAAVEEMVAAAAAPIPVDGADEVGQVAAAFNAMADTAGRLAAGQARERASVTAILATLAWRLKRQSDGLTVVLDELQKEQTDPDLLEGLFRLDHAATRFRREVKSLLEFGGEDVSVRQTPVPLRDVLRASLQSIELYRVIHLGVVDPDTHVVGAAVEDLVHLLTELLDNATKFSPPDSRVWLEAARVGDHAYIHIRDAGVGMDADQLAHLNGTLQRPGRVDVAATRHMGIPVVASIAARLGIGVSFRSEPQQGTRVDITLPQTLFLIQQNATFAPLDDAGPAAVADAPTQEFRAISPARPAGPAQPTWQPLPIEASRTRPATATPGAPVAAMCEEPALIYNELRQFEPPPLTVPGDLSLQPDDLAATEAGLPVRRPGAHHRNPTDEPDTAAWSAPAQRDPDQTRFQLAGFQRSRASARTNSKAT